MKFTLSRSGKIAHIGGAIEWASLARDALAQSLIVSAGPREYSDESNEQHGNRDATTGLDKDLP